MTELAFQSAVNLVKAIKEKVISSSELLELYIERYERFNPQINAVVETDFENARKRAKQADKALREGQDWGPLHGLPITIKDSIEVTGLHATMGSPTFKDYVSSRNADVVQSLLDAGAIVYGKTNIPLMAGDSQSFNEVYGQTNNPWDLSRTPGGSSGGAAAALAAGLTGLEMGSDNGGSIRSPAHFCGVYGHKPSYGIVPWDGQMGPVRITKEYELEFDLAVSGPLARSAEDLDLAMELIVRPARPQRKAVTIKLPPPRRKTLKEYKIGLWLDDPVFPPDNEVGNCLQKMADRLSNAGANIQVKKPDINIERNFEVHYHLFILSGVVGTPQEEFDKMLEISKTLDKNDHRHKAKDAIISTSFHRDWQFLNIERLKIRQKWNNYFKDFDALLTPVARIAVFQHDHTELLQRVTKFNDQDLDHLDVMAPWTGLTNISYLPATVAPVGITSGGLPVGVQIIGPYLEDRSPIHIAGLMEKTIGGFMPPPGFA